MKLAIEMDQTARNGVGYSKVHKAGCRDLHDPEPVKGEVGTRDEAIERVDAMTGWEIEPEAWDAYFAPCVKLPEMPTVDVDGDTLKLGDLVHRSSPLSHLRLWQVEGIDLHGACTLVHHESGDRETADSTTLSKAADKPEVWCTSHGPTCNYGCIRM